MRMASSVGSAAAAGAEVFSPFVDGGALWAFFFAAGFFGFGLAAADRAFFFGPPAPSTFSAAEFESAALAPFSGSILDFLATIVVSN